MDSLPFELYPPILGHLDLHDLFSLRAVCRKLNLVVKHFKIRELYVYPAGHFVWPSKGNWSHTGQPYDFSYSIREDTWPMFSTVVNSQFLKKLKCTGLPKGLNELKSLEHLEVHFRLNSTESGHMKLALPELKAINFSATFTQFSLELETPKLQEVTINVRLFDFIQFNYPLAITHLRTSYYVEKVATFRNLQIFEFEFALGADFLANFAELRVLKIASKIENLAAFIRKRDELTGNLRIYCLGIELLNGDELDAEREFSLERMSADRRINRMPFYLKYYGLLDDNLSSCPEVFYGDLLKMMPKIPGDFFRKFNNIQSIKVSIKVEDPSGLLEFIGCCQNLCELTLTNGGLNQPFYDSLPRVSSLFTLSILGDPDLTLNFNFLATMKRLQFFKTDQELHMTAELPLDSFRYLHTFIFKIDGKTLRVLKSGTKGKYVLESSFFECPKQGNFSKLLGWCEHIGKSDEKEKD